MKYILSLFLFLLAFIFFVPHKGYAASIPSTSKVITVDLEHQMLYALDNGQVVYQTPISSGLSQSPTVRGTFHIYQKLPFQEMRGVSPAHGFYDLPNVPNVMYFSGGEAIHGTYWHHNFGHPMSNGCVNASLGAAAWLYNFAPVGTRVVVY